IWGGTVLKSPNRRQALQLKNGPDLDSPLLGTGNASCDSDRVVEVRRVDQEEAAELFARFSERAVRHLALTFTDANAGRGRYRVQWGSAEVLPLFVEFMRERRGLREALLALAFGPGFLVRVDEQHVFHRFLLGNPAGHRRVYSIVVREVRKSTSGRFFFTPVPEGACAGNGVPVPVRPRPKPVHRIRGPRPSFPAGGTGRRGPREPGGSRPNRRSPGCRR